MHGFVVKEVRNFLYDIRWKWYDIGIELDVDGVKLDAIKAMKNNEPSACLYKMIQERLKDVENPLTWRVIAEALNAKTIGEMTLARQSLTKAQGT